MHQRSDSERDFFNRAALRGEYDVFHEAAYDRLLKKLISLAGPSRLASGRRVIDLGCGSGAVIRRLQTLCAAECHGVDISAGMVSIAQANYPGIRFRVGDILHLSDYDDESFDVVLYSGVLHHFPDMSAVLKEGYRILKKGGCLLAFDPNRRNPAMWLYRDPRSPLYSSVGKTENEILLDCRDVRRRLREAGFRNLQVSAMSGITFRRLESGKTARFLPLYNVFEKILGFTLLARWIGSFLISYGEK